MKLTAEPARERYVVVEWEYITEVGKTPRLVGVAVPDTAREGADCIDSSSQAPEAPPSTRDFLTVVEAAARLGTTVAALKKRLARGARRDGRRIVCTIIGDTVTAVKLGTGPRSTWRVHFRREV